MLDHLEDIAFRVAKVEDDATRNLVVFAVQAAPAGDDTVTEGADVFHPEARQPDFRPRLSRLAAAVDSQRSASAELEAAPERRLHLQRQTDDVAVENDHLAHVHCV